MAKRRIILLGKLPPPYIGPAIATEVLLKSSLKNDFELLHFNTTLNTSVDGMGRFGWSKLLRSFAGSRELYHAARDFHGDLALVPISQTTVGFIKDSLYILALRRAGVPVLVQLRGSNFKTWFRSQSPLVKWWVRFCLQKTEGVVVLGEKLKPVFEDFFPPDRIFVAPNGADYPELRGSHHPVSEKIKVLYLSNFLPGKGFDIVLRALGANDLFKEKIELEAYGGWDDPGFKKRCEDLIQSGGLTNISLNAPISGAEKWRAFNEADLFVFVPRHPEGHPWAIVEAMAAGLPVISTDRGAITESVHDGENGFIVNAEDHAQLAEKLTYFCDHPDALLEMGAKSRELYESHFTGIKMADRYRKIFNHVVEQCAE